jgi:Cd2+/Zn2+-exporting ATPase
VPLAFFSGIGAGSKQGILFKDGLSMEALAAVKAVVMDKTGTITKGDFSVKEAPDELLRISACCEQHSTHPIAASIVAAARQRGMVLTAPEALEEIPGHGIRATLAGREVLCGNEKLMALQGIDVSASQGVTTVHVAVGGALLGSISISDTLKPDAPGAVAELKNMGIATAMLTGDHQAAAEAVARESGIEEVYAGLLPEEKLEKLRAIRAEKGAVMFVGDGINDAPVLSGADVGAAMGSGADAAIEAADVVFMTSQAAAIPEAVRLARVTRRIAWQNVVFALAVKAAVMVLGLLGHASMWAAVFADSGVAMLCVLNAIRMLYPKK